MFSGTFLSGFRVLLVLKIFDSKEVGLSIFKILIIKPFWYTTQ